MKKLRKFSISLKVALFRSCIAILMLVIFTGCLVLAEQEDFVTYCNGPIGFCVDYPKRFTIGPEPVNRNGRRFYDSKGFVMIAARYSNVLDNTLDQEMKSESQEFFDKITNQTKEKNCFVLQGYKGTDNIYVKAYVGEAAINILHIKYPRRLVEEYEGVVLEISRSFKPGRLNFPE